MPDRLPAAAYRSLAPDLTRCGTRPGETPPAGARPEIEGKAVILEHERPVPTL